MTLFNVRIWLNYREYNTQHSATIFYLAVNFYVGMPIYDLKATELVQVSKLIL